MNPTSILKMLEAFGMPMLSQQLVPVIQIKMAVNPAITDDELVSEEAGTIKHAIRGKIGWLVDFIWSDIAPSIDTIILQAAADARASNPT